MAAHARDARLDGLVRPAVGSLTMAVGALSMPGVDGVHEQEPCRPRQVKMASPPACWNVSRCCRARAGRRTRCAGRAPEPAVGQVLRHLLEVVGPPVGPVAAVVPLDEPVVPRHARAVEAGPSDPLLADVQGGVDPQLSFQLAGWPAVAAGRSRAAAATRWPRTSRRGRPAPGWRRWRQRPGRAGVVHHAVGVIGEQAIQRPLSQTGRRSTRRPRRRVQRCKLAICGCQDRLLTSLARPSR